MSGASVITTQWKAKGFHLHLFYFKQSHHVAGSRSLLLQHARKSPQEHCGPYECTPHSTHAATHTWDLYKPSVEVNLLVVTNEINNFLFHFQEYHSVPVKKKCKNLYHQLWTDILEENIHISMFVGLFCECCQSSWLKNWKMLFFTLDHLQKTSACFSAPSLIYRFHYSMSSTMVWKNFQLQHAAISVLHRKILTSMDLVFFHPFLMENKISS